MMTVQIKTLQTETGANRAPDNGDEQTTSYLEDRERQENRLERQQHVQAQRE